MPKRTRGCGPEVRCEAEPPHPAARVRHFASPERGKNLGAACERHCEWSAICNETCLLPKGIPLVRHAQRHPTGELLHNVPGTAEIRYRVT
jgi:hypothetical protein